jgi:hypothetical protein
VTRVLEITFAASLGVVALSLLALVLGRVRPRDLLILAGLLGILALAAAIVFAFNLDDGFAASETMLVSAGGIAAAAVAEAGLAAFARGLGRLREIEALSEGARASLAETIQANTAYQLADFERVIARERAAASQLLAEQERQLAEERRDVVARQGERARVELTEAVTSVQERLERRLTAWAADLDRGQRELEVRLGELSQRQREAVESYEARLAADAERIKGMSEEQRLGLLKLRDDLKRLGTEFLEEGRSEIEVHAAERRRALHEVAERVRARERALRDQVDHEEAEAKGRLSSGVSEAERRHLASLERALERAANRLAEASETQFDAQIKASREKAAERLAGELERGIEQFARQAEQEISDRISQMARATADRLQRRIAEVARTAEAQHELAADRIRRLSERLDETLAAAEERAETLGAELSRSTQALDRD